MKPKLWQKAASMAGRSHEGQYRKDGVTPYVTHPFRVALIVRQLFGCDDDEVLAAALLHDTLEDTTTDYDELAAELGPRVAGWVALLSKDKRAPESERETVYFRGLRTAPWQVRLIKMADSLDNHTDAPNREMRRKAAGKARKILAIAGREPELARAKRLLGGI